MDKPEATKALIPNVRLKSLTCDVTNYKNETRVINKMRKNKNQNILSAIGMKELSCKELSYFDSFKLSLYLHMVMKLEDVSSRTKYMCYI